MEGLMKQSANTSYQCNCSRGRPTTQRSTCILPFEGVVQGRALRFRLHLAAIIARMHSLYIQQIRKTPIIEVVVLKRLYERHAS